MKNKLTGIMVSFIGIFFVFTLVLYLVFSDSFDTKRIGEQKVILNEIKQLGLKLQEEKGTSISGSDMDSGMMEVATTLESSDITYRELTGAISTLEQSLLESNRGQNKSFLLQVCIGFFLTGVLFIFMVFAYIHHKIIRPFHRLEDFASDIAAGNLDSSLQYERINFFGSFTWAFDHMRKEIHYAKEKEAAAIEANKTIIASLSHDIKTPIASIRAYSEGLEANLDASFEKRQKYLSTIMRKCDEVTALVNDLVLHSLSELEKLDIEIEEVLIDSVVKEFVEDVGFDYVKLAEPLPSGVVLGDKKRILQILENLVNNARKYAEGTDIEIYLERKEAFYSIHVKDHGKGILPEDMPFILDKFYRGKNVKDMPGSGLGLYIVDYLVKQMQGKMTLHNSEKGLDVEISLPLK